MLAASQLYFFLSFSGSQENVLKKSPKRQCMKTKANEEKAKEEHKMMTEIFVCRQFRKQHIAFDSSPPPLQSSFSDVSFDFLNEFFFNFPHLSCHLVFPMLQRTVRKYRFETTLCAVLSSSLLTINDAYLTLKLSNSTVHLLLSNSLAKEKKT